MTCQGAFDHWNEKPCQMLRFWCLKVNSQSYFEISIIESRITRQIEHFFPSHFLGSETGARVSSKIVGRFCKVRYPSIFHILSEIIYVSSRVLVNDANFGSNFSVR